jgi:pimeloyl-ACP methyl ester carboxylesterase
MSNRPPVVLVHGAANSSAVWAFWAHHLRDLGWDAHPLDLRGHGQGASADLALTSMSDYADDVAGFARRFSTMPIVIGWSMGGLIAMMVASAGVAHACVGLAPSLPASREDSSVPLRKGTFGPEEYGIVSDDPAQQPSMPDLDLEERAIALGSLGPESRQARDERKRGIVIRELSCPLLIVTGTGDTDWRGPTHANLELSADYLSVDNCSHWGLVLNRRALNGMIPAVSRWMGAAANR